MNHTQPIKEDSLVLDASEVIGAAVSNGFVEVFFRGGGSRRFIHENFPNLFNKVCRAIESRGETQASDD